MLNSADMNKEESIPIRHKLKRYWRIAATGLSFIAFGLGTLIIGLLFLIIAPAPAPRQRKQHWIRETILYACRIYQAIMRSFGLLTFEFKNENPPGADFHSSLVMANHPTLLDAVFLLSYFHNTCCIVKGSLWRNPFTSIAVRLAGYIPNNSENLIELASEKIAAGENILIFPEGTRNVNDSELCFKRGAANIAVIANSTLTPVLINCQPRTLQKGEKWYQIPPNPPHFRFEIKKVISLEECIDTGKPRTVQYRHLTDFLTRYYRSLLK